MLESHNTAHRLLLSSDMDTNFMFLSLMSATCVHDLMMDYIYEPCQSPKQRIGLSVGCTKCRTLTQGIHDLSPIYGRFKPGGTAALQGGLRDCPCLFLFLLYFRKIKHAELMC